MNSYVHIKVGLREMKLYIALTDPLCFCLIAVVVDPLCSLAVLFVARMPAYDLCIQWP